MALLKLSQCKSIDKSTTMRNFLCPKSDLENILYDTIRLRSTQNARCYKRRIAFEETMKEWKSGLGQDFDEKLFGVIVSGRIVRRFANNTFKSES